MKKNIIYGIGACLAALCISSCDPNADVIIENDNSGTTGEPYATINQYTVDGDYNPDNDTRLRVTFNGNVSEAYYLVELSAEKKQFIEENGEQAYMQRVVDNGTSITIEEETRSADIIITGIAGENDITVVSVGKDKKMKANTAFFTGITWMDVCTGTYYTTVLTPYGIPAQLPNKKLQVADVNPNMYRIVDLYKSGYSLKFTKIENSGVNEGGKFNMIRVQMQEIGLNFGEYGPLYIQDIGYWRGDDSFVLAGDFHGGMYEDNSIFFYHAYCISTGQALDYKKEYFIPDAE
ncbi:MAG: hypothetical protein IKL71_05085 [Bacteroidaceae bacterium]|nr:hypothetical protein [Bacteroidaceae bacterium]